MQSEGEREGGAFVLCGGGVLSFPGQNSTAVPHKVNDLGLCIESVSLAGVATSIIFVATNILSQQCLCRSKSFVMPAIRCDKHKLTFVTTKHIFCHDKHNFVTAKVLSQQAYFCCNKRHVLSRQK